MNISIIACAENNYYERQHHFECSAGKFDEKKLYYVIDYILQARQKLNGCMFTNAALNSIINIKNNELQYFWKYIFDCQPRKSRHHAGGAEYRQITNLWV